MSHTSTIKAIKITSISALRAAVQELREKKGINITLEEGGTPRAYFQNQAGMGKADYVLRLPSAAYDIGLYADGKGGFEARTDFFGNTVERVLGGKASKPENQEQAKLGLLFQSYGIQTAMEEAKRKGLSYRRVQTANGGEQLILTGTNL